MDPYDQAQGGITFSAEHDDPPYEDPPYEDEIPVHVVSVPDHVSSEEEPEEVTMEFSHDQHQDPLQDPDQDEFRRNSSEAYVNTDSDTEAARVSGSVEDPDPDPDDSDIAVMDINGTVLPHPELDNPTEAEENIRNQQRSGYIVQSGDYDYASPIVVVDIPDQDPIENEIVVTDPELNLNPFLLDLNTRGNGEADTSHPPVETFNGVAQVQPYTQLYPTTYMAEADTSHPSLETFTGVAQVQHPTQLYPTMAESDTSHPAVETMPGYTSIVAGPAYEMQPMSADHNGNPDKMKQSMADADDPQYYFKSDSPSNMTGFFAFAAVVFFFINLPCGLIALCLIRKGMKAKTKDLSRKYGVWSVGVGLLGIFITAAIIGALLGLHFSGELYD